eukprot:EG_transcript_15456
MDSSREASDFGSDAIDISDIESELAAEELAEDNDDDCSEGDAEPCLSPLGLVFAIVEDEQLGERHSSTEESEHPWWAMLTLKGVADHPRAEGERDEGALLYLGVLEDDLEVEECERSEGSCEEASGSAWATPGRQPLSGRRKSRIAAAIELEARIAAHAPSAVGPTGAPPRGDRVLPHHASSSSSSSSSSASLATSSNHVQRIRGLAFQRVTVPEQLQNADVLGLLGIDTREQREARLRRDKLVVSRLQAERRRAQDFEKIFHEVMQTLRLATPLRERQHSPSPKPSPPILPFTARNRSSSIRRSDGFGATKKGQKVKLAPLPSADEGENPAAPAQDM